MIRIYCDGSGISDCGIGIAIFNNSLDLLGSFHYKVLNVNSIHYGECIAILYALDIAKQLRNKLNEEIVIFSDQKALIENLTSNNKYYKYIRDKVESEHNISLQYVRSHHNAFHNEADKLAKIASNEICKIRMA